jgi:hypothetical protein
MKITVRTPGGGEISFEGDPEEFNRFTEFLADPPAAFVGALQSTAAPRTDTEAEHPAVPAIAPTTPGSGYIDPNALAQALERVGARTDIERVTVMAQAAVDAGLDGIDYPTVERLFGELGQPRPGKVRATFGNAKRRGLVRNVASGRWRPTVAGENYAKYGQQRGRARVGTPQGNEG